MEQRVELPQAYPHTITQSLRLQVILLPSYQFSVPRLNDDSSSAPLEFYKIWIALGPVRLKLVADPPNYPFLQFVDNKTDMTVDEGGSASTVPTDIYCGELGGDSHVEEDFHADSVTAATINMTSASEVPGRGMDTDLHTPVGDLPADPVYLNPNSMLEVPESDADMEVAKLENTTDFAVFTPTAQSAEKNIPVFEVAGDEPHVNDHPGRKDVWSASSAQMLHESAGLQSSAELNQLDIEFLSSCGQSRKADCRSFLSSETGATLFHLMDIRSDRQDLSYVQKIILRREQIASFCLALRSESIREPWEGELHFRFEQLDLTSLHVIGIYGSKNLMAEILERCKAIAPGDLISEVLRKDSLSPGLYALLYETTLHVFYWHGGAVLPSATRKDISCNFVRYLVDLCDSVFVLPEREAIREASSGSISMRVQQPRTRKMRVEKVKETENSIKIITGFSVPINMDIFAKLPGVSECFVGNPTRRLICDGARCGFPSFTVSPPGNTWRSYTKYLMAKDQSSWQGILKGKAIDFSKLGDDDLRVFLHYSGSRVGEEYAQRERRLNEEKLSRREKQDKDREQRLAVYEEQVCQRMMKSLTVYMAQRFSWEEAILRGATLEELVTMPFSPADEVLQERTSRHSSTIAVVAAIFSSLKKVISGFISSHPQTDPTPGTRNSVMNELERNIWTRYGNNTRRFIFPTNRVRVFSLRKGQKDTSTVYTIQHAKDPDSSPVVYNRTVLLTSLQPMQPKEVLVLAFRPKDGPAEGPLLTNTVLLGKTSSSPVNSRDNEFILEVVEDEFALGGLQQWVASEVDRVLPLGRRAALLSYALDMKDTGDRSWSASLTPKVLSATGDFSQIVQEHNPNQSNAAMKQIRARWEELRTKESASKLSESVVLQCKAIYEKAKEDLFCELQTVIKRYYRKLLNLLIQEEDDLDWRVLCDEWKKQESNHLNKLRDQQLILNNNQKVISLHSCVISTGSNAGSRLHAEGSNTWKPLEKVRDLGRVCLKYEEEVLQTEKVTWKVVEISPSKNDIDRLEADPHYSFIPKRGAERPVLNLDSSRERLLKLVFLKTGQFLAFTVQCHSNSQTGRLQIMLFSGKNCSCVHKMDHGFDLIAFDERSRFVGFYSKSEVLIRIYRFEDEYKQVEFSGAEVSLQELGVNDVIWMEFISGREELLFVDSNYKIRVFEMVAPGMVRPKSIQLPGPFVRAQVTRQGPCFLVFSVATSTTQRSLTSLAPEAVASAKVTEGDSVHDTSIQMDVYWIDDTMAHVSTSSIYNIKRKSLLRLNFEVAVHSFGIQEHLLLCIEDEPDKVLSQVLKITSASEVFHLSSDSASKQDTAEQPRSADGQALDYMYHVYEKYATNPPLVQKLRSLSIHVILHEKKFGGKDLQAHCLNYLESSFRKLQNEKAKNFGCLDIQTLVHDLSGVSRLLSEIALRGNRGHRTQTMGEWVRQFLCLVPIQIARAENNCLTPLADGLELSAEVDYVDSVSLANVIRFGSYESVFASWHGPMKIISSMGKQSSGKSYVLNHLSGSLLDVSGGRCTDGVWMTVRISDGCLYVLLDFEGLGTLERSEQEDMLLAVLNAAVSDMTIYNKKDFYLDKETENVFRRFQNGVVLVKDDQKLFSGMFYMAIKDVGTADVCDVQEEFERKIKKMLGNSTDNFLTRMYGGVVEVATMAAFDTPDYYRSIGDIRNTIELLRVSYTDGGSFSRDLKLVIAQLSAKDWAPLDSRRMALRLSLLRTHLSSAVSMGSLNCRGTEVNLVNFDSQQEIPDHPILLDSIMFSVRDTGLNLQLCDGDESSVAIMSRLKLLFEDMVPRSGSDDESWFSELDSFKDAVVDRRKSRVLEWISCNFQNFHQQDETQIIRLEATALCAELKQNLSLCGCRCYKCFLKCTRKKGHSQSHDCLGEHACSQPCTYCERETVDVTGTLKLCDDVAGHEGYHDCKLKSHTCKEICAYHGVASNCNCNCAGAVGHSGEHLCNSRQHMCEHDCSLEYCKNPCVRPFEVKGHFPHACHEKFCPMQCTMSGCNRVCASMDHFHNRELNATHFCGYPHPCAEQCEQRGNCAVQQDLIRTTKTFRGKYGNFEYEHIAEQNGIRKDCCIEIPPFQTTHEGPHSHTLKKNAVHLCDTRCHSCGYFCVEPIGHTGLHNTVHGNMRGVTFAAETEKIEMEDRTYAWGESGAAEMCNMYCTSQGRGHIHLIECPSARTDQDQAGVCYSKLYKEGVRHETREYGPHPKMPKDEMTHAAYWRHMRFTDPCGKEDQTLFGLCGHECTSEVHRVTSDASASKELRMSKKSFCIRKLWHPRVSTSRKMLHDQGYITLDGHQMGCSHLKLSNVVFVIDRSSSMSSSDMTPTLVQLQTSHNNRLGCVFEAILRFVRTRLSMQQGQVTDLVSVVLFHNEAVTAIEPREMAETFFPELLSYIPEYGTVFSKGLQEAEKILLGSHQETLTIGKIPVVIFLSDGENYAGDNDATLSCIRTMKSKLPELVLHTVIFGSTHGATELMAQMAKAGDGTFNVTIDGLELSRTFVQLARSLKPRVVALI